MNQELLMKLVSKGLDLATINEIAADMSPSVKSRATKKLDGRRHGPPHTACIAALRAGQGLTSAEVWKSVCDNHGAASFSKVSIENTLENVNGKHPYFRKQGDRYFYDNNAFCKKVGKSVLA